MTPDKITIHCSDTKNGLIVPASEIKRWHVEQGWDDIGYHLVIQPTGEAEWGRDLNKLGAHVLGANNNNIGICLVGKDKYSRKQLNTLAQYLDTFCVTYNIPTWDIYGHYEFDSAVKQKKTCPNLNMKQFLYWYNVDSEWEILKEYLLD